MLHLFAHWTCWRLSASNHKQYLHLSLGSKTDQIGKILLDPTDDNLERYPCVIRRLVASESKPEINPDGIMLPSNTGRLDGVRFWMIRFRSWELWVKLDNQNAPSLVKDLLSGPDRPLVVWSTPIDKTKATIQINDVAKID